MTMKKTVAMEKPSDLMLVLKEIRRIKENQI